MATTDSGASSISDGHSSSSSSSSSPPQERVELANKQKGYQGFGSFHSDNVEELIRIPASEYRPHKRAVDCSDLLTGPQIQYGASMSSRQYASSSSSSSSSPPQESVFLLDPSWTFINHGAFGGTCRAAMRASQRWAEYAEQQPLRFIDRELFPLMCDSIRALATRVLSSSTSTSTNSSTIKPECLALLPNATYGLTSIIESFLLQQGDTVFMLDIGYGSVKKMLYAACARNHLDPATTVVVGTIRLPTASHDALTQQVIAAVPLTCKLAVIDHITSNTGIVMDIQSIILGIRAHVPQCRILIDGAHGLASHDLSSLINNSNLSSVPDYYVSNAHKWLCSTKGLAFMYIHDPAIAATVRAAVISHGYGSGYTSEFIWDGCRDYSAAVSLPTLLDWWDLKCPGGLDGARTYCRTLLKDAVKLLTDAWGTGTHMPMECYSHMACVQLPASSLPPGAVTVTEVVVPDDDDDTADDKTKQKKKMKTRYHCNSTHGKMIQDTLHYVHSIECPVKTLPGPVEEEEEDDDEGGRGGRGERAVVQTNRSYVRISAMVYNTIDDYKHLADAVLSFKWE